MTVALLCEFVVLLASLLILISWRPCCFSMVLRKIYLYYLGCGEVCLLIGDAAFFSKHLSSCKSQVQPAAAMAQKTLRVTSPNGDERTVFVVDTTTMGEILQQCQEDGVQDRQATLIQGVTVLEPDMTVSEVGLEDGAQISLLWSNLFVEMARWTGEEIGKDLYVRIPPGTTSIDPWAFNGCKALVKVVIPNSVTSIGAFAFYGCSSLIEINIPDSVKGLGGGVFHACHSLRQVEIPNSVTIIGEMAFRECSFLTQVEIPNSVTSIEDSAFCGCSSLTKVEIPKSVTRIAARAFENCSSLTEVNIPNSVTSIEEGTFCGCSSLTEVQIPTSVTRIAGRAFENCSSLRHVDIPSSVRSIDPSAFGGCPFVPMKSST